MNISLVIKSENREELEKIKTLVESQFKVECNIYTKFDLKDAPTYKQKQFAKNIAKELNIEFDVNNNPKKTISDFIKDHKDEFFNKKGVKQEHLPNPEEKPEEESKDADATDDLPF